MKKIILAFLFTFTSLFAFEQLNYDNFDEKIKDKKAIIDFYAVWCPPCRVLAKNLKEYDAFKADDINIYKVDIDKYRDLALKYGVSQLPTLVYFEDGIAIKKVIGLQDINELKENEEKIFK